jgi:hypothetical protein
MSEHKRWTVDQDHDIRVASWRVAELIYGADDGSMERDAIECDIQEVIVQSFDFTTVHDGPKLRAECGAVAQAVVSAVVGRRES